MLHSAGSQPMARRLPRFARNDTPNARYVIAKSAATKQSRRVTVGNLPNAT
jgi:hypothetical protein